MFVPKRNSTRPKQFCRAWLWESTGKHHHDGCRALGSRLPAECPYSTKKRHRERRFQIVDLVRGGYRKADRELAIFPSSWFLSQDLVVTALCPRVCCDCFGRLFSRPSTLEILESGGGCFAHPSRGGKGMTGVLVSQTPRCRTSLFPRPNNTPGICKSRKKARGCVRVLLGRPSGGDLIFFIAWGASVFG